MDTHNAQYVVTPWRSRQELLDVRQALYASDAGRRESAVNKVLAWRLRKPQGLPLLLDSTADIVDVILQDEKNELTYNAMRLLYATAISRFITGLADTQIDLTRDKPAWFPPGKTIQLPLPLLEIRHRIVHRHLPSLAELKRAAQDSLKWLWEWYWSQLDHAFGLVKPEEEPADLESVDAIKGKLQAILKTYVKERKMEIKNRKKESKAAETAASTYNLRYSADATSTPSTRIQGQLVQVLIHEKMILPTDKKLGSSMSGAFLIWSPFLLACNAGLTPIVAIPTVLGHVIDVMNASPAFVPVDQDPVRDGLCAWASHILTSEEWADAREQHAPQLVEEVMMKCFSEPTFWNLKLATTVLENEEVPNREQWVALLQAAKSEDGVAEEDPAGGTMDVDVDEADKVQPVEDDSNEKVVPRSGPRKAVGIEWKSRPIGWRAPGWEDDE